MQNERTIPDNISNNSFGPEFNDERFNCLCQRRNKMVEMLQKLNNLQAGTFEKELTVKKETRVF